MLNFDWDIAKDQKIRAERGVGFEAAVMAVNEGKILDDFSHPNVKRYPAQRIFVIAINAYAYLVPYVQDGDNVFLKTIIPSRKATRQYLNK